MSQTLVDEAQARVAGLDLPLTFQAGDAHALDFPDDTFDGVRADRVLHHVDGPARVVSEMVRVARPGAGIVAMDPDFDSAMLDSPERELTRTLLRLNTDTYRNGWMGRQVRRLFKAAGLVEIEIIPFTITLTEYAHANTILALEATTSKAVDSGLVQQSEALGWLEQLQAASSAGDFFAACTTFIARGRKPPATRI